MGHSKNIQTFVLVNIDSSRKLGVIGTWKADFLIGSHETSDILNGGLGSNTYVVGGLEALVLGAGDRSISLSTTTEADKVELGLDAELIHIGSTLQNSPGQLENASGSLVTVRGGSSIQSFLPSNNDCVSTRPLFHYSPQAIYGSIALSVPSRNSPTQITSDLTPDLAQIPPNISNISTTNRADVPGVPSIFGFNIAGPKADRISISAANFTFNGRPVSTLFPPGSAIPILLVDHVRHGGSSVVSSTTLARLIEGSPGLKNVRSDLAPLVYFRSSGLLVLSRNSQPLGSKRNPGTVIARLLNQNARPLRIPGLTGQIYQARFLSFQAPPTNQGGKVVDTDQTGLDVIVP
jgi:hypothetical protein